MTDTVFRLLVIFITAFVAQKTAEYAFHIPPFGLSLEFGPGFSPVQLITHIFLNGSRLYGNSIFNDLIHILFQSVILWSFGSELERLWGSYHFLKFFYAGLLGGIAAGALVYLCFVPYFLAGIVLFGFGAGLSAVLVAYAMIWPDRQVLFFFVIPVKMKWMILILLGFYAVLGESDQIIQILGGAVAGSSYIYYYAKIGRSASSMPKPGIGERIREYFRKRRLRRKQYEIEVRITMKDEVDRLLEKISKHGMKSLSRKEKAFLDSASREF